MDQPIDAGRAETLRRPPPLNISRLLHARRETVFAAWTAAEHVKHWFSPETYTVADAIVQPHTGGAFDVCMRAPTGEEHWSKGKFVDFAPHSRLAFESHVTGAQGELLFSVLTKVDFSDGLCGTQVDVTQTYEIIALEIATGMVGGAAEGWRTTLDKLEQVVVRLQGAGEVVARSVVHATFHLERTYPAPAARVWKALTDETAKAKWFGGAAGRWELIERHMDVCARGRERLKGRWEGGVVSTFDAVYHDVIEGERLVYTYEMHMDDRKISVSLATVQLRPDGAGTTLMITEQGAFLDGYDDAGSREQGTGLLMDALGASLTD